MSEKHPDIFNPQEAAEYLHLDSPESLRTLRAKSILVGYEGWAKHMIYHRADLNLCALKMCGKENAIPATVKPLKTMRMTGGQS